MWNLEKMVQMNLFAERVKDTNVVNGCWTGRWGRRWDASGLGLTYRHSPGCAHARLCRLFATPWTELQSSDRVGEAEQGFLWEVTFELGLRDWEEDTLGKLKEGTERRCGGGHTQPGSGELHVD